MALSLWGRWMNEVFHEFFEYREGNLFWKKKSAKWTAVGGPVAPYVMPNGYLRVGLKGKRYYAHRLIYCMFHNEMPQAVDHINGDRSDNRIENLRAATTRKNNQNRTKSEGTSSQYKGVHFRKDRQKWQVQIKHHGKSIRLGCYFCEKEAALAYNKKAVELFGEFAKLNQI
ncbi:MAG: HNH endonuclease [Bacteroidales bacterium]